MTSRALHLQRAVVLAAAAMFATATVACAGNSGDDLPPPPPSPVEPAPWPTAADPEHQAILDVYYGAVEAMVVAQQAGDPEHPDLMRYFLERTPALINVQGTIRRNGDQGRYYAGELAVVTAQVTSVDMDAVPPTATVESCVDYAHYRLVHRDDDSPVPGAEPLGRHPETWQAVYGSDHRWYIATGTTDWDRTC